jgi:hypothetical protein
MSISNMFYEIGSLGVVTDGYITRIPQSEFYGGGGGLANTRTAYRPDAEGVARVIDTIGGASKINIFLSGHSHFDHSFDTATWSRATGARIIGPKTTCFQTEAEKIQTARCTAVFGGEKISLAQGVTVRVVRLNHSGDDATNPEQHTRGTEEAASSRSGDEWAAGGLLKTSPMVAGFAAISSLLTAHRDSSAGSFKTRQARPISLRRSSSTARTMERQARTSRRQCKTRV